MNPNTDTFIQLMMHPVKFRMFLFSRLPGAFFAVVRVREAGSKLCAIIK